MADTDLIERATKAIDLFDAICNIHDPSVSAHDRRVRAMAKALEATLANPAQVTDAAAIVEALFQDIRDRRFLKWLFPAFEGAGPILHDQYGEPLMPFDLDVQGEIKAAWAEIITAAIGAGRSSEPEFETAPDNGTPAEVLAYVLECARRWVPEARIIGNARAGDIERAITAAIGAGGQAQGEPVAWQHRLWYADSGRWSEWRDGHRDELLGNKQEERPLYTHPAPSGQAVAVWRLPDVEAVLSEMLTVATGEHDDGDDDWLSSQRAAVDVWQAAIRSAIAHPVQPGWRDMESAPKDGTEILAAILVHNTTSRWWERHVIAFDPDRDEISQDHEHGWGWEDYEHWMPLPAAPQPKGE